MSFEETLRDRLEHDASTIALPAREPGRAVTRARARRRHRLTFAGVAAATAVAAAAVPLLTRSDHAAHDDKVAIPRTQGREPTGPLDLAWRTTAGGLRTPLVANAGSDGSIYALGSAAATDHRPRTGNYFVPPTLYKLAADGTWQATALGGDKPSAKNVVSANGKLYALSTAPADRSRLSVSEDGGQTWTARMLPPGDAPAGSRHLVRTATAHVASNGKDVLAMVSTSFDVKASELFPEMRTQAGLVAVERPEGISLVRYPSLGAGFVVRAPDGTAKPVASSPDVVMTGHPGQRAPKPADIVKTLPWSAVGLRSPADLGPTQQVYRLVGARWELLATDPPLHLSAADIHVAGRRFVIGGSQGSPAKNTFFVSDDGRHWQQLTAANGDYLVGAGPALVSIPLRGTTVRVSQDGGASWKNVVLPVRPGEQLISASGGELGVAILYNAGPDKPYDLAVSGDLASWTVEPLESIVGPGPVYEAWTAVGNDKIVVSAVKADGPKPGGPAVTAVGTPVRR